MFEKVIECDPAYDKRDDDSKKNYGVGALMLRFILKSDKGAVQFVLNTGWYLPHVQLTGEPMPWDLGYHSPVPMYDNQPIVTDECPYLDGKPCYYDGSSLNAEQVFEVMLREGIDSVWAFLEEYHHQRFG
jgi:hypothetical protein